MTARRIDTHSPRPFRPTAILALLLPAAMVHAAPASAQHDTTSAPNHEHGAHGVPAAERDRGTGGPPTELADSPLEQPGNGAFATIQEVVEILNSRPDTDWSRVDLEALRQHLVEMERFTLEAEIVEREEIDGGLRVTVRAADPEVNASLRRVLHAHAPVLEAETGWRATATDRGDATALEATAETAREAAHIRGLGYIGLMATGAHHPEHHWQIATGGNPHTHDR